jgi:predicted dehydrogenase
VPVLGLLGSTPNRARPVAKRHGIPRVYRDIEELLDDREVGSVHVASPNRFHFAQARDALESGKHVLCEKPLATTVAECRELAVLAGSRPNQVAAVCYNVRFYPHCHEMRARVARGDLGRILSVTGSYTQDWLLLPDDSNWRLAPEGGPNLRAVADIGTHWMDLAQFVTGRFITSVCADLGTVHARRAQPKPGGETFARSQETAATFPVATEDVAFVLFHMSGGAQGAFHVSQAFAGRKNRLLIEIAGERGSLVWDSESPEILQLGQREGPNGRLSRDPALLAPTAASLTSYPGGHAEGFSDTFKQLFRCFYARADCETSSNKDNSLPSFHDGYRELAICEAIAASHRHRGWVDVAPDCP